MKEDRSREQNLEGEENEHHVGSLGPAVDEVAIDNVNVLLRRHPRLAQDSDEIEELSVCITHHDDAALARKVEFDQVGFLLKDR